MNAPAKRALSVLQHGTLALLFVGWVGTAAQAQDGPMCNQQVMGQVSCMANRMCECIYDRGGSVTGVPEGFRWNCSINRASCEVEPGTIIEYRGNTPSIPYSVSIERSDSVNNSNTATQSNTNTSTQTNTNTNN